MIQLCAKLWDPTGSYICHWDRFACLSTSNSELPKSVAADRPTPPPGGIRELSAYKAIYINNNGADDAKCMPIFRKLSMEYVSQDLMPLTYITSSISALEFEKTTVVEEGGCNTP